LTGAGDEATDATDDPEGVGDGEVDSDGDERRRPAANSTVDADGRGNFVDDVRRTKLSAAVAAATAAFGGVLVASWGLGVVSRRAATLIGCTGTSRILVVAKIGCGEVRLPRAGRHEDSAVDESVNGT